MTVGEMIVALKRLPPTSVVVTRGGDHSYDRVSGASPETAEAFTRRTLLEYAGDEHKSDPDSPLVQVVVIE